MIEFRSWTGVLNVCLWICDHPQDLPQLSCDMCLIGVLDFPASSCRILETGRVQDWDHRIANVGTHVTVQRKSHYASPSHCCNSRLTL
jgi:hypothetical protein